MRTICVLLKKELLLELRSYEFLAVLFGLSLLLSVIIALGVQNAVVSSDNIIRFFPTFIWVIFLFSSTTATGRSFESELEHRAIDAVIMSSRTATAIYCSKVFVHTFFILLGHVASTLALAALLDMPLHRWALPLLSISIAVSFAYSSLSTLLASLTSTAKLRGVLLPLILFPALFPLFLAAVEITLQLIIDQSFSYSSFWFTFLLLLDLIYFLLGLNLYEFTIKD